MEQSRRGMERVFDRYDDHPTRRIESELCEQHSDILSWPIPPGWEDLLKQLNAGLLSRGNRRWAE
jgi:hypothetical protein